MIHIIYIIIGYLIGSIPFGLLLTTLAGLGDIRKVGSGNIGATNVLRMGNKKLAAATLLLDMGKGFLAAFIGYKIAASVFMCDSMRFSSEAGAAQCWSHYSVMALAMGITCILGHLFPVWLKFKGGKGVATGVGVLLAALPITGLAAMVTWIIVAFISRISSLAALSAFLIAPIITFFVYGSMPALLSLIISALVWWRHEANIKRLLKGEEAKISFKKQDAPKGP